MGSVWADLKFAFRMLAKTPSFTAILVITLALGVGASTAIFSVVHSVLVKPLPYKEPDRLVRVFVQWPKMMGDNRFGLSPPEVAGLLRSCESCESVASMQRGTASLTGGDRPVRVQALFATSSLLPLLGVSPELGRYYSAEEDRPGDPTAVVLGHDVWQRAYGGDPTIIGRTIQLDAMPVTVVGVMPEGFDFPGGVEAWVPAGMDLSNPVGWGRHNHQVTARLKPGVGLDAFQAELTAVAQKMGAPTDHPIGKAEHPMIAVPLKTEIVGSLSTTLWLLQGAVLFVLLIAIVNITNLLLARAETRTREVAVRHAVGATRGRLVRQLMTESVLFGLIGGGLGVLVAVWALEATIALLPDSMPRAHEIVLDAPALLFALGCTLASSIVFGLAPVVHTLKTDVHSALKEGTGRASGSRTRMRVRGALVVAEVALAIVLLIGCVLMVTSLVRLQRVQLGFEPARVLQFEVELPVKSYPDPMVNPFWRRLQERLRALPGVEAVTLVGGSVPERPFLGNSLGLPGRAPPPGEPSFVADYWQDVGDDAFAALGARIVRGRGFDARDVEGAPPGIVVNEAFVRKFLPDVADPIGVPIDITPWDAPEAPGDPPAGPVQSIIGVVADMKNGGVDKAVGTEVFFSIYQGIDIGAGVERAPRVLVRTNADPMAVASAVQQAVAELDPNLPVDRVQTMDDVLWEAVARPRLLTFLLVAFAFVAVILAAIGIYGVMAYTVAQRTHEFAIRVALGAQPQQVLAMVMRQAGVLAALGAAGGLLAAAALALGLERELAGAMYGYTLRDPILFAVVAVIVVAAAIGAAWVPARRATRVDPNLALKAQ
jgi:putative ABC transport system permease protein